MNQKNLEKFNIFIIFLLNLLNFYLTYYKYTENDLITLNKKENKLGKTLKQRVTVGINDKNKLLK